MWKRARFFHYKRKQNYIVNNYLLNKYKKYMRYRRYGRPKFYRRYRRKSRYSRYRSKRWNKKKLYLRKLALSRVAERKWKAHNINGFLSGD